jgi:membrane protein DedA with SNARE-associated domain
MAGLPIPSSPAVLAMGALAGRGYFQFAPALLVGASAANLADILWYALGRWRGEPILRTLCRLTWDAGRCTRRAARLMDRYGVPSLLFTKFIAGVSLAAPAVAGVARIGPVRFTAWDTGGSLIWPGFYLILGAVFDDQLEAIAARVTRLGAWAAALLAIAVGLYIGYRYYRGRRSVRRESPG